jgi:hypothetical protein
MASAEPVVQRNVWLKQLQPALFSVLLLASIFSGVKLGQFFTPHVQTDYIAESLVPLVNEMKSEPLEIFLLD